MKPSKKPSALVYCPTCNATGLVSLTGIYLDTLLLLRKQRKPITGAAFALVAGCKPTAMNNRLAMLEKYKLVKSERYGRMRLYAAVA